MSALAGLLAGLVLIGQVPAQLPGDCLLCHQAAVVVDMAFSMKLLRRFVEAGAVQYAYCSQPGRQVCVF